MRRNGIFPPKFDPFMRVGNPPLLFWAMSPLTHGSFMTTAKLWSLGMYVVLALGFWGCLVCLGWRRRWLPLLLFLALPQTIYAAFYGNVDALVFASLAWSAALARKRPYVAGALLVIAFLKPQVGLPGAFLIILFMSCSRRRAFAGFVLASVVVLTITAAVTGFQYVGWWLDALTGYSQRLGVQPDIASLSGLYIYSASDQVRVALEAASLAAAAAATLIWWARYRGSQAPGALNVAWLWIVWFLATPFAHFHDEVIIALPVMAIVGTDARWLGRWPATLAVFVLLFSILLFPTSRAHADYQSLTLVIVLACAIAQLRRSTQTSDYAGVSPLPREAEVLSG